jgi:predicted porin
VEKTREHIGSTGLKWQPRDNFDASVRLSRSSRDASDYQAELTNQNPLLRKYTLADRDRDTAGLLLNYAPMSNMNIGLSTDLVDDDYTDSDLGLTDAESKNYNLDLSYYPAQNIQLNAFYSHDRIESRQVGSPSSGSFYKVNYDDKVDTLGLGANFDDVWKSWDLGINYRYSKGTGEIKYTGLSTGTASNSYPDLENELHHVELSAAYDLKENTRVKFSAIYEHMRSDDWALDGIPAYPANQLLTLGNDTEEYNVFAFMVAVQHRF